MLYARLYPTLRVSLVILFWPHSHTQRFLLLWACAAVSGLGFGLMSTVITMSNMLDMMSGPGMVPARGCDDMNLFTISSLISAAFCVCHTFWGVIAGKAWEQVRSVYSCFVFLFVFFFFFCVYV